MIGSGVSSRRMLQVDARDYGVIADGTTNNASALAAAISASSGKTLMLPTGTIGIGSMVNPSVDNVRMVVQPGTTVKRLSSFSASSPNGNLFNITRNRFTITGGGTLDGGFSAGVFESLSGVAGTNIVAVGGGASRFVMEGVTIQAPVEYISVALATTTDARISDCEFIGNSEGTSGATRHNIYGLWTGTAAAVGYVVERCTFRYFNWSAMLLGGIGTVRGCVFADNHWSEVAPSTGGAQVAWESSTDAGELLLEGNVFQATTHGTECNGIEVFNPSRVMVIRGNTITGQSNSGIVVGIGSGNSPGNVVIADNVISSNYTGGGTGAGISISGVDGGVIVTGNRIYDDQGSPTQTYGISIASSDNIIVTGNDLRGNGTGPLNTSSLGSSVRIVGNLPTTVTDV